MQMVYCIFTQILIYQRGARIVLWPSGGLSTSMDWYGFGNSGGLVIPSGTVTIGSATAAIQS